MTRSKFSLAPLPPFVCKVVFEDAHLCVACVVINDVLVAAVVAAVVNDALLDGVFTDGAAFAFVAAVVGIDVVAECAVAAASLLYDDF